MREKPSAIDIFLSARPEHRDAAGALAVDPGLSVDQVRERLQAMGCQTSRSAVGRWRLRVRRHRPGPMSSLRHRVVNAVLVAPDAQLRDVAQVLKLA